ncbi:MAG: hypothetical protein ACHQTF_11785 [Gemmatimonadales bacterium]
MPSNLERMVLPASALPDRLIGHNPPLTARSTPTDSRLTHAQYEALERAITDGRRIVVTRRGTEFVVVPLRLRTVTGREVLDARHPTTGDSLTLVLDELDQLEPIPGR